MKIFELQELLKTLIEQEHGELQVMIELGVDPDGMSTLIAVDAIDLQKSANPNADTAGYLVMIPSIDLSESELDELDELCRLPSLPKRTNSFEN